MDLKNTPYWQIYADVFTFFKSSMPVRNDDPYWQQVVDNADALYRKYEKADQAEFAKTEIFSVIDELERIYKRKRGDQA